ncbi:glucose-1-phosphate thymidylyltransferase [Pseudanabaena sp. FACHB-1998]|uniref:glucose-1-phosphate thymidylyltransferase n=1 Tax=Pseudanabaena sp. FACHB-1998 TaxID=2692858 RepID=UPI00168173F1|nr:glucose-1-phosphate thymidylyltransferase [Pseudanabaena sp. FACHB-1998]MBD2177240.1 glucose-1-phosphate thymidylyltransferase [Pseudanabaena sp. FACHB-1998]
MKALILSGGKGTRLRPLTFTGAKQLVPVANKPILWYCIESIVDAGITDIGIIISPETGDDVRAKTGNGDRFGAKIEYILQTEPAGLAHAVKTAQPFLGDDAFVMFLGDNLIESPLQPFLQVFKTKQLDALILLRQVANPTAFGVATVDENGKVLQLEEKPKQPKSNLALVGVYFFQNTIHQAIAQITPSARGELEITDALQKLIETKQKIEASELQGWWLDTGKKDEILEANQIVLDTRLTNQNLGEVDSNSNISGRVNIGKGSRLVNCKIRGPVIIGENCYLEQAYVGPYTSISDRVTIVDTDIEHSVILSGTNITGIHQRIVDSVIGKNVKISRSPKRHQALRFLVGDESQLEII